MKISVITSLYKGKKYINDLIVMLNENIELCNNVELEYIIINDYPDEKIVKDEIQEKCNFYIKIINNEQNLGIHKSRINGVKNSTGEYIIFLDQDDTIEHNYLYSQISCLKDNTDIVIANGWQKGKEKKKPIFYSYRHQNYVTNKNFFIIRSPIISPGQCLIKKNAIPNEWLENVIINNGADDYFLWILMLYKNVNIEINYKKIFNHNISNDNFSNNYDSMKKSSLEVVDKLKKIEYVPNLYIKKIKRMNIAKIGTAYGIKKTLEEGFKYPDVLVRLLFYRLKLKLLGKSKKKTENNIKNFVTYISNMIEVLLKKDVGVIPIELNKMQEIKASLLTYETTDKIKKIANEKYKINLDIVKKIWNNYYISLFFYIKKHAKEIDILNLYHMDKESLFISKIYSHFNKRGLIYLKMDIDSLAVETYKKNKFKRKIMFNFFNKPNCLVSVENTKNLEIFKELGLKNIIYIQNGFYQQEEKKKINKENIILNVARLGTKQKNTELLLDSFKEFYKNNKDWKLQLVGPMEEGFKKKFESNLKQNNDLNNAIKYLGEISDENELYYVYSKAKIFALSSRWDSFAIVLAEALYNSCYILGSKNIDSINDISNFGQLGYIVSKDTVEEWTNAFEYVTKNIRFDDELYSKINKYALENFDYEKICKKLYMYIIEKEE